MLNPLPTYTTCIHALDATLADIRILFQDVPPDVEIRGRLMGPRCSGRDTIEIAYPLRPKGQHYFQVLIPEPNLWEPDYPYRYEGPVEFWRGQEVVGKVVVSVGLKKS